MQNTKKNSPGKKLLAKAFYTEYSLGDKVLEGWEASPLNDRQFLIKRLDGSSLTLELGQIVPNIGSVSLDFNGNLSVGSYTVIQGRSLLKDWRAKKTRRKGEYLFRHTGKNSRAVRAVVGDMLPGIGVITGLDEFKNIQVGPASIPVDKKKKELKLLVYTAKHAEYKSGYQCHFNLLEPGSKMNHRDGASGVFFPSKDGRPAKFCETDEDGRALTTAVFWPSKDKTYLVGKVRSIGAARIERALYEKVSDLSTQLTSLGICPDDHADYVSLKEHLDKSNKEGWSVYSFTATDGHTLFGLPSGPSRQHTQTNEYAHQ